MKRIALLILASVFSAIILSSCATAPSHSSLQKANLPPLIPLREFFVSMKSNFGYRISPDGKKIGWIAVKKRRLTIHYKTIGEEKARIISTPSGRSVFGFSWAQDSRRMLYWQDQDGNENYHICLADTDHPERKPVDLTPFEGTRAWIARIVRSDPDNIMVGHNQRDKKVFDLYRINLNTHTQTLIAENPGDVFSWVIDQEGRLRARIRKEKTEVRYLEILDRKNNTWKGLINWGLEDTVSVLGFTHDEKGMWLKSNRGRDRIALVCLDLKTGKETLIYEDPQVDLGWVLISYLTKKPLVASSFPDYPKLHFFDQEVESDAELFKEQAHAGLNVVSSDNSERILTVATYSDKNVDYYLYNRNTRKKTLLSRHPISAYHEALATMKPIAFKSRDGMTVHGYLTLPKGNPKEKMPMVLFVHGGPWARDYWGYRSIVQFLANRGYAVLQINYRGSTGYGRAFKQAAIGEFAGKMHTDLIDGVQWAIDKNIADPNKIGIFGFSYGGYATLVGLTFTPDTFSCGVDVFGISNLVSFSESVPKYWKNWMPFWHKYVGDPEKPEDRRIMETKSPLFRVNSIKRPLLIAQGANDVRVTQKESDQMVSALKKAGKEVEYILFPDEGHSIRKWKNRLVLYRKIEDFLAKHLGGRSAGFDYYELGRFLF